MHFASPWLMLGAISTSAVAHAATKGPSDNDVYAALKPLDLDRVHSIRCEKRELGRMNMGGEPTAKAVCSYRYFSKSNDGNDVRKNGRIKLSYSGIPCGGEGQEVDLICYDWLQDYS